MISKGQFESELNQIENFLNAIGLLDSRNYSPSRIENISELRSQNLFNNWKLLIQKNIFNFQLKDNSILNFEIYPNKNKASYLFIEGPYKCLTYDDFLNEVLQISDIDYDKIFSEEYYQYLQECKLKDNIVYIRYDLDYSSYRNGLHPVSHLHIGHNNQIRIGINKTLTPIVFINFILRQHYNAYWKQLLETDPKENWIIMYERNKNSLIRIEENHFCNYDIHELYFD